MLIQDFLERSAQLNPDKIALVCNGQSWTFGALEAAANRLAHGLIKHGVERWDHVAICLDNSPEAVICIFAVAKVGGAFLPLGPSIRPKKLAFVMDHSRATALIIDASKFDSLHQDCRFNCHPRVIFTAGGNLDASTDEGVRFVPLRIVIEQKDVPQGPPQNGAIDIDPAALIYTSGSTGNPKGVVLTHLNIVSATTSIVHYLKNTSNDVILNVLPLCHSYALTQLMTAFHVGATLVLEGSFHSPYKIVKTITQTKVTGFALVPTIASSLVELDLRDYDFSSLRYMTNAAAALPTPIIRKLRAMLPHVDLFSMYGLTECIRASYLPPDQVDIRPTSIGRGMPNQEVYIVDEVGQRLGPGAAGELIVRGSNVMSGYWAQADETRKSLKPGPITGEKVLHTGDLFRMDDQGYLYFVGRKDDMIKTCGEKVSPREIEEVICSLEAVAEAAVLGVPDEILGQAIKAIIRLKDGAQLAKGDVVRHCAQQLEDFKVPTLVEFCDSFPMSPGGKIMKRELISPNEEKQQD